MTRQRKKANKKDSDDDNSGADEAEFNDAAPHEYLISVSQI